LKLFEAGLKNMWLERESLPHKPFTREQLSQAQLRLFLSQLVQRLKQLNGGVNFSG
jgi:hypothetical protein